jgi:long-chain acyl-CoA synthetase
LDLSGLKKALFFWALQLTEDYAYDKTYKGLAKTKRMLADKLIFSKWRAALGGQLKGIITGAAPCPLRIAQVFSAAGIPIREGYGLTEASPGISISLFEKGGAKLGTVGPVLQNVEVEIDTTDAQYGAGEGEVLATGPNIMIGYYNKPDQTSEMLFEKDGKIWLRTGDIGKIENYQGRPFLKITDRKKELLKTSGGKYVAPAPIENKLKEEILIEQVMVVGDQRNFVTAIIVPAMESLKKWCSHKGLEWDSFEHAVALPEVNRKMNSIVDRVNPLFSKTEQIKKFKLVCDVWEPTKMDGSESELTPTLKLKRRVLQNKYQTLINDLYVPDVQADI